MISNYSTLMFVRAGYENRINKIIKILIQHDKPLESYARLTKTCPRRKTNKAAHFGYVYKRSLQTMLPPSI